MESVFLREEVAWLVNIFHLFESPNKQKGQASREELKNITYVYFEKEKISFWSNRKGSPLNVSEYFI